MGIAMGGGRGLGLFPPLMAIPMGSHFSWCSPFIGVAGHLGRRLHRGHTHLGTGSLFALLLSQQQRGLPGGRQGLYAGRELVVRSDVVDAASEMGPTLTSMFDAPISGWRRMSQGLERARVGGRVLALHRPHASNLHRQLGRVPDRGEDADDCAKLGRTGQTIEVRNANHFFPLAISVLGSITP